MSIILSAIFIAIIVFILGILAVAAVLRALGCIL
jgi:hypothetical protein